MVVSSIRTQFCFVFQLQSRTVNCRVPGADRGAARLEALDLIFQEKAQEIKVGTSNSEIYFETEDLDDLYKRLAEEGRVIHSIRTHPWGQRAFRVYDPDDHIIEFAESMESVVLRLHNEGFSLEEIANKSMMPMEFISMALNTCE